ncbi:MAG: dynamin family protein [Pseudomonadota bacterium]
MTDSAKTPRIILLGEFSAGKSTLVNALLEQERSPMRATASHVPPIWYSHGTGASVRVTKDGSEFELDTDDISAVPMDDTQYLRVFVEAPILERCDLIDMPGSSDPNMSPDIWDAVLPQADGAIWCTPSTQAWRQSEAAIWEEVPEELYKHSLLLLTRIDKVRSPEDRARLHARISREVSGQFRGVFPVALLQALQGSEDEAMWRQSGMAAFNDAFGEIISEISKGGPVGGALSAMPRPANAEPRIAGEARSESSPVGVEASDAVAVPNVENEPTAPVAPAVVPRRVTRLSGGSTRPRRAGSSDPLL